MPGFGSGVDPSKITVPSADSADNNYIQDVVGNKSDSHSGGSLYSKAEVLVDHIHHAAKCYPTLTSGVTVTKGAGAWALGNFAEIVPASTIGVAFDIHHINIESASADGTYELILYAATTEIGRLRFTVDTGWLGGGLPSLPFQCGIEPADTQIQAKVASGNAAANNIAMSIYYHTY